MMQCVTSRQKFCVWPPTQLLLLCSQSHVSLDFTKALLIMNLGVFFIQPVAGGQLHTTNIVLAFDRKAVIYCCRLYGTWGAVGKCKYIYLLKSKLNRLNIFVINCWMQSFLRATVITGLQGPVTYRQAPLNITLTGWSLKLNFSCEISVIRSHYLSMDGKICSVKFAVLHGSHVLNIHQKIHVEQIHCARYKM